MNKKIILGSILSVVILILLSFTSVIGYQSVESNIRKSPLFNIRTSRAIDEDSNDLRCEYVGKGEKCSLSISKLNENTELLESFIEKIKCLNDKTFNRFIGVVVNQLKKNGYSDIDNEVIITGLNELRTDQEIGRITLVNWENQQDFTTGPCTLGAWVHGCWLYWISDMIIALIKWLLLPPGEIILAAIILFSVILVSIFVPDSIICNL